MAVQKNGGGGQHFFGRDGGPFFFFCYGKKKMRGLKKTAPDGADRHTDRRTWRLLDKLGHEGQVGEKREKNTCDT